MRSIEETDLLTSAINLAIEAGEKILVIYNSNFQVEYKDDNSPLTAADLAAHECLVAGLANLEDNYPVLSEESAGITFAERSQWETYWLIDPLDGTKEYVKRNGEFTVNIALIHRHKPVLGVVYAPVPDITYFSTAGSGAYKMVGKEKPELIHVNTQASKIPVVVGSRSHQAEDLLKIYLSRLGPCQMKPVGSSLKFCLVAEGAADVYPRLGPTSEWDTAAAHCVVESAGGRIMDLRGESLLYNTKPSLLNPYFIVCGNETNDWISFAAGIDG